MVAGRVSTPLKLFVFFGILYNLLISCVHIFVMLMMTVVIAECYLNHFLLVNNASCFRLNS